MNARLTRIYLDNNATTPVHPQVQEAMDRVAAMRLGNPASQHASGRHARRLLEDARERVAELLGARLSGSDADRLIFTSGGTEANNLALLGIEPERARFVITSAIEHPSVSAAAEAMAQRGARIERLGVNSAGQIEVGTLDSLIEDGNSTVVSLMLANNETGVMQPLGAAGAVCSAHGALLHTDAAQAVGKIPVHFRESGAAMLTFAAHKFHGPLGIGGLLLRHDVNLRSHLFGGHQQAGLRPGTEPVVLAVGMCKALETWAEAHETRREALARLRDRFEASLKAAWPRVVVNGALSERLPNTSNVAFPGFDRQALLMALDLAGVECSAGSACASGAPQPSPILVAMGLDDELVLSSLRFSLGAFTTAAEVDEAIQRIIGVLRHFESQGSRAKNAGASRQQDQVSL